MPVHQGIYGRYDSLVAEVEQESILFLLEISKFPLEFLMERSMACHHAAAHRVCEPPLGRSLGIRLSHFRVICKTQIVVQAPVQDFLASELHVRTELAFELREHVISERLLSVLYLNFSTIFCSVC